MPLKVYKPAIGSENINTNRINILRRSLAVVTSCVMWPVCTLSLNEGGYFGVWASCLSLLTFLSHCSRR